MALRILLMLLSMTIVVNLVIAGVSLIIRVNLYEKYGKQILNFFIGFGLFVIAAYVILAIIGLI